MRHRLQIASLVVFAVAIVAFFLVGIPPVIAEIETSKPLIVVVGERADDPPTFEAPEKEPDGTGKLAGYTLTAMLAWMPPPAKMAGKATHLASVARDSAWVALDEMRAWDGSDGAREALVLASIGWHETLYRDYVDSGDCNRWAAECYAKTGTLNTRILSKEAQELMKLGTCDGGTAWSVWQLHVECGQARIFASGAYQNGCSGPTETMKGARVFTAEDMKDRRSAARVALAIARQSIRAGAGLRNYVGGEGPERAKMAAERLDKGLRWYREHPFTP